MNEPETINAPDQIRHIPEAEVRASLQPKPLPVSPINDIPTDETLYRKMVAKVHLRMLRSAAWSMPDREKWVRYYKIWRKIVDDVYDPDEPNIFLGYAFALVEQIHSKTTEPILKMRPPCGVLPMRFGDGQKAENFKQIARNWYSKPNMQEPFCRSKKEMAICGTRWEVDEWLNIRRKGKMWGKVPKTVSVPMIGPDGNPVLKDGKPLMVNAVAMIDAEVEREIPIHYGFNTRYPSIFNMYPEPDRPTIGTGMPTDAAWVIEDMGELALEDMIRECYTDPVTGESKPLYDFSKLLKSAGKRAEERYANIMRGGDIEESKDSLGPVLVPVAKWNFKTDYGQMDKDSVRPTEGSVERQSSEDRDKVWVVRQYQANEILTIANGSFIIQRIKLPWHVPIMPIRVESYTIDPEFIYGHGVIEPIEDEVSELNDIHNLSMSQWIRIINKMIAVRTDALVDPNLGDFKPRAGGKIRVNNQVPDVRSAIASVDQPDPTMSMLQQESNMRGLIEFISSNSDLSPGASGTKQTHKTYKGLMEIQSALAVRFVTIQRQGLINEARRMMSMQRFFDQFGFEKQPYRIYRDDGSTALAEFNKDDIYTEGRGFEFTVEIDPTFGDTAIQRQQDLYIFDRAVEYEKVRSEMRDPNMRRVDLSKLFEKNLRDFGYVDTSQIFNLPDESRTPDDELQIIMQGGTCQCSGDLMMHITEHLLQMESPNLKKAIEAGKAAPDTIRNLQLLIQGAMARMVAFTKNPQGEAERRKQMALAGGNRG